jgi:integrase/recombinase XerD
VRRFLAWRKGEGVELIGITPGMVGQYIVVLGGSASKRDLHLSALRGFVDRLVQRLMVMLNPAASVSGVKEDVVEWGFAVTWFFVSSLRAALVSFRP